MVEYNLLAGKQTIGKRITMNKRAFALMSSAIVGAALVGCDGGGNSAATVAIIPAAFNGYGSEALHRVSYSPDTADISATCNLIEGRPDCEGIDISIVPKSSVEEWKLQLYAPVDNAQKPNPIEARLYATASSRGIPGQPYMGGTYKDVDGMTWGYNFYGWFKVLEFESAGGQVATLAVDFAVSTRNLRLLENVTYGSIRINSSVPLNTTKPTSVAGESYAQLDIEPMTLSGAQSYSPLGPLKSYHWQQVAGPLGTITSPDSITTDFKPSQNVPPEGTQFGFRLDVTDAHGEMDSSVINIDVQGPGTPVSMLHMDAGNEFSDGHAITNYILPTGQITRSWLHVVPNTDLIVTDTRAEDIYQVNDTTLNWWCFGSQLEAGRVCTSEGDYSTGRYSGAYWDIQTGVIRHCTAQYGTFTVRDVAYKSPDSLDIESAWIEFETDCQASRYPRNRGFLLINHPLPPGFSLN